VDEIEHEFDSTIPLGQSYSEYDYMKCPVKKYSESWENAEMFPISLD
jgi:hypothetical protein